MYWFDTFVDLLVPEDCAVCGAPPARVGGLPLCTACSERLPKLPRVAPRSDAEASAWSLADYRSPLGLVVQRAKLRARPQLLRRLGAWAAQCVAGRVPAVDAVVPVPSSGRRGVSVAAHLARPVAKALGVPVKMLVERHAFEGQEGKSPHERRVQAARSYRVPEPTTGVPRRVLLLDDVRTTGATLEWCAVELLGAGVERVHSLSVVESQHSAPLEQRVWAALPPVGQP